MKHLLTALLLLLPLLSMGQKSLMYEYIDDKDKEKFFEMTKPGNKVYITSENEPLAIHAKKELRSYHWKIVDKLEDADFVLYIDDSRIMVSEMSARIVYIDPKTERPFYKTHAVNTLARFSYHAKKGVVRKLIRKRVYNRVNELDNRESIPVYTCGSFFTNVYHIDSECEKLEKCNKVKETTVDAAEDDGLSKCKWCYEEQYNIH